MSLFKMSLALLIVTLFIFKSSQSFMFDQCGPRHTNLTQECVGKFIIETLVKVTEDPENFITSNQLNNESGTTMRFIKLKFDNDTMGIDQRYEIDESRSWESGNFWDQLVYAFKRLTNYSNDHGILLSLPQWSKTFPPVTVVDENDIFQVVNEMVYLITGRSKHPHKKYALLFPLLATFKFLVIKALLVPILMAVMIIKKMMVLGVMALPTLLTMLRFCRNPNFGGFGFGAGNLVATGAVGPVGQAAAFAPLTADISGDYSSYVQQSAAASQQNNAYKDYSKNLMDAMKTTYQRR
ncbi:uncharacterized protein LOC114125182 isoform X1 [Aphis gossypii]|uniref:Uncharacterized protein n=1 Tax=Aphis gossypii TaxID=80765 RepID=A0A9P0IMK0_APHGO|nr:uncharacterized protein LOC114125182 isoform X1 [Aphis gossypii]XP_050054643.1 uncharacterized protein LOC114125182 isoform X1 [Aphis gossypii]CAH1711508.1 unnamed protein product [Aphis gossypii]